MLNRTIAGLIAVALFLLLSASSRAQDSAKDKADSKNAPTTSAKTEKAPAKMRPLHNLGRGFANLGTAPLEIPRCMIYDNGLVPLIGIVWGAPEGAIFTTGRMLGGLFDILTCGFSGKCIYNEGFPEFVWDAPWLPPEEDSDAETKPSVAE